MKLSFVTVFPNDIATELQRAPAIEALTMVDLLTWVSMLTRDTAEDSITDTQLPRSEVGVPLEVNL